MHNLTRICTCLALCLESLPTPSHMNFPCMKICFQSKIFFIFENSLYNLQYQNSLDNYPKINPLDKPPIRFVGQPFDIIYWASSDNICTTTLRCNLLDNPLINPLCSKSMLCTHTHFTQCSRAYELWNAISCRFMLHETLIDHG